mmetsp:Transcript_9313/g.14932  ORF Transcript_9313/g.14932 Transcript_9313/m.14932 type:complete len:90 (+) Transcript_9313:302-571(+)
MDVLNTLTKQMPTSFLIQAVRAVALQTHCWSSFCWDLRCVWLLEITSGSAENVNAEQPEGQDHIKIDQSITVEKDYYSPIISSYGNLEQ